MYLVVLCSVPQVGCALSLLQGQACTPEELDRQADVAHRCCSMEVLLVRAVEKMLDAVNGNLEDLCWNAHLTKADGLKALQVRLVNLLVLACCAEWASLQSQLQGCMHDEMPPLHGI